MYGIIINTITTKGEKLFKIHKKDGVVFETDNLSVLDTELKTVASIYPVSKIKVIQNLECTNTLSTADDMGNATGTTVELTEAEIDALYDKVKAKIYA